MKRYEVWLIENIDVFNGWLYQIVDG